MLRAFCAKDSLIIVKNRRIIVVIPDFMLLIDLAIHINVGNDICGGEYNAKFKDRQHCTMSRLMETTIQE